MQQEADTKQAEQVEAWVAAARDGSQPAYSALYRRFLPLVHGILISRWSPADADDLTQECFTRAFQQLGQLRELGHFGAWIASIARNLRPKLSVPAETDAMALEQLRDSSASPELRSEADTVLRALGSLPEAYRETLALRLVEGLSGPDIAALTGLSTGSVRVNLHRGMGKLREALGLAEKDEWEESPHVRT